MMAGRKEINKTDVGVWNKLRDQKFLWLPLVYRRVGMKLEGANFCEDHHGES